MLDFQLRFSIPCNLQGSVQTAGDDQGLRSQLLEVRLKGVLHRCCLLPQLAAGEAAGSQLQEVCPGLVMG